MQKVSHRTLNILGSCFGKSYSGKTRKYPINPDEGEKLPIFEYNVSKKDYRRLFAWGNMQTGALGVPYLRKGDSVDKIQSLKIPKRTSFGEKHEVTAATCGFGFSVFAVNSDTNLKIYGTGINTDSQIGYHEVRSNKPLEILFYPQPISLPFVNPKDTKVLKLAAGRAHLAVLTAEGLFTLGNNAYGQCGRRVIVGENYAMSNYIHKIESIDGKIITDIECGQDHTLAITKDGSVYACGWGADGQTGQGHFKSIDYFRKVKGDIDGENIVKVSCRSDFNLALNDKGDVFGWGNTEYGQMTLPDGDQQLAYSKQIDHLKKIDKIKSIASGGSFCVVVGEKGHVFSWGYGLLGVGPNVEQSREAVRIPETLFGCNVFQPNTRVEKVVCGLNYAAATTNLGDLFVWGRNKCSCLGLGGEKDQYFPLKVSLGGYVTDVLCGIDHTLAICKPFV